MRTLLSLTLVALCLSNGYAQKSVPKSDLGKAEVFLQDAINDALADEPDLDFSVDLSLVSASKNSAGKVSEITAKAKSSELDAAAVLVVSESKKTAKLDLSGALDNVVDGDSGGFLGKVQAYVGKVDPIRLVLQKSGKFTVTYKYKIKAEVKDSGEVKTFTFKSASDFDEQFYDEDEDEYIIEPKSVSLEAKISPKSSTGIDWATINVDAEDKEGTKAVADVLMKFNANDKYVKTGLKALQDIFSDISKGGEPSAERLEDLKGLYTIIVGTWKDMSEGN